MKATLYGRSAAAATYTYVTEDLLNDLKVELSHDPNYKTPSRSTITTAGGAIEYRIDFQNDGVGIETDVIISDELETFLTNAPEFVEASHPNNVNPIPVEVAPRVWQWNFKNMMLKGTHAPDYTPDKESETKGWIKFKVPVGQVSDCQAIVNRARIVFKCQPPIYTTFAYTLIPCVSGSPSTICVTSDAIWQAPITNVQTGASISQLLDNNIAN